MPAIEICDNRLFLALHKLCARGLDGEIVRADLAAFNRLDVNRAEELFGERRIVEGNPWPMYSELKWLFQHLDGRTRSLSQLEVIAEMESKELRLRLSPNNRIVSHDGLHVPKRHE